MSMLNLPKKVYFKTGCTPVALRELNEIYHAKRAFLVSDVHLKRLGVVSPIRNRLEKKGLRCSEFFSLQGIPTVEDLHKALPELLEFAPDVIVGIGGNSALSTAKLLRLLQDYPDLDLEEASQRSEEIHLSTPGKLVLLATSFCSGAQNTPLAIWQDMAGGNHALKCWDLLPIISITDADYTKTLTQEQIEACYTQLKHQSEVALTHSEDRPYTHALLQEVSEIVENERAKALAGDIVAIERLHYAGSIAGTVYGNLFNAAEYLAMG